MIPDDKKRAVLDELRKTFLWSLFHHGEAVVTCSVGFPEFVLLAEEGVCIAASAAMEIRDGSVVRIAVIRSWDELGRFYGRVDLIRRPSP